MCALPHDSVKSPFRHPRVVRIVKVSFLVILSIPIIACASDRTVSWSPAGSEYSVVFQGSPEIKEIETIVRGKRVTCLTAEYLGNEGFERADALHYNRTEYVTKDQAVERMTEYATNYGMGHIEISFDDTNREDIRATLKGVKTISTQYGDVVMNFFAVCHWGRESIFSQIIGEAAKTYPSKQGQAFLSSVRRKS